MDNPVAHKTVVLRVWEYLQKHRRQIVVFILCLAVSSLLWLTIILNRYYVHSMSFKVYLAETDESQRLIPLQNDTIMLDIKAQGYQLLFNEISMARNRELVLRKNNLRKSSKPGLMFITSRSLLSGIASKFPTSAELLHIRPDTLFFRTELIDTVMVQEIIPEIQTQIVNNLPNDTQVLLPEMIPANLKNDSGIIKKSTPRQNPGE